MTDPTTHHLDVGDLAYRLSWVYGGEPCRHCGAMESELKWHEVRVMQREHARHGTCYKVWATGERMLREAAVRFCRALVDHPEEASVLRAGVPPTGPYVNPHDWLCASEVEAQRVVEAWAIRNRAQAPLRVIHRVCDRCRADLARAVMPPPHVRDYTRHLNDGEWLWPLEVLGGRCWQPAGPFDGDRALDFATHGLAWTEVQAKGFLVELMGARRSPENWEDPIEGADRAPVLRNGSIDGGYYLLREARPLLEPTVDHPRAVTIVRDVPYEGGSVRAHRTQTVSCDILVPAGLAVLAFVIVETSPDPWEQPR